MKVLAKTKGKAPLTIVCVGLGPNVDFFSTQELEELAKKFKEEALNGDDGFEGPSEEKKEGTMASFFDSNLR